MNELQARAQAGEISAMRALLWAGLLHQNPDFTQEQVGDMVGDFKNLTSIMESIAIAVVEGMPDPEEEKGDDPTT